MMGQVTRRHARLRRLLVDHLVDSGLLPPQWSPSFLEVRRHDFVPATVWVADPVPPSRSGGAGASPVPDADLVPMRRDDDPDAWLDLVYRDTHIVTQVDDGHPAGPGGRGVVATSSSSQPSVMAIMLAALDAEPGHRVLEVGAGTGYNAALLAHRVGAANVTTVDIDPAVAAAAGAALAAAGFGEVTVVTGDGELGHPDGAPYDRVICTAGVRDVPFAWVRQTRPGGRIVAPWSNLLFDGGVLTLTVDTDGERATGHLTDRVAFMSLRGQRVPSVVPRDLPTDDATTRTSSRHPDDVVRDPDALLAISLRVPNCRRTFEPGGGLWFIDQWSRSWALVRPDRSGTTVHQHGPRLLWDEIEQAHDWWLTAGSPATADWQITITPTAHTITLPHTP